MDVQGYNHVHVVGLSFGEGMGTPTPTHKHTHILLMLIFPSRFCSYLIPHIHWTNEYPIYINKGL